MASVFTENLVGRVLDQRYALTDLVGIGGSARVYRAEDRRLRRMVAVKVLHSSFADDEGFVRRFRHEAEALAPLSHPNIVTVFDVNDGENASGEPPFLVTEYLGGGTLRDLLDDGYRLSVSQAARIGLDAARGLAFAHGRDLVHRDIKPANLLFGDDQRIRIADFGLAKALQDFGRTDVTGAPLGSARYMSPEQAKVNAAIDGRSDIYSLALVLIEAVTGSVPFIADTLAGTTVARLEHGVKAPTEMGALAAVIESAGTLDPADRLDATSLVAGLEELLKSLPRAEPLPLDGSRIAIREQLVDRDPTRHAALGSTEPKGKINRIEVAGVPTLDVAQSKANKRAKQTGIFDLSLDETQTEETSGSKATSKVVRTAKEKRPNRFKKPFAILGVVSVLAGGGAGAVAFLQRTPTHEVPMLEGKTLAQAKRSLAPLKFELREGAAEYSENVPAGKIISQNPDDGIRIKEQEIVEVVVSKGTKPITVPTLTGLTEDAARGALVAVGLSAATTFPEASETVEVGKIIRWSPQGDVAPNTGIVLVVSSGKPSIAVPKLAGLREEDVAAVVGSDFVVEIVKSSNDAPKGTVFGTEPKTETVVQRGTPLKVFVSTGPSFAVVPNVIGLMPADASAQLRAAGFRIGNTIGPADQPVLHTRPLRRTRQRRGAIVTLYTTDANVPEVPGVPETRNSNSTPKPTKRTTKPAAATATEPPATPAENVTTDKPTSKKTSTSDSKPNSKPNLKPNTASKASKPERTTKADATPSS